MTTVHTVISAGLIQRLDGYAYRSLEKYSKEEVIRRMEEEIENKGGTVMSVQWTEDQKKVIELRNRNILVSAAAGSEKRRFW